MPRKGRGYSVFTAQIINDANPMLLGVKLGRICVAKDIPVTHVAEYLGINRAYVQNWFTGKTDVHSKYIDKVEMLINKLS